MSNGYPAGDPVQTEIVPDQGAGAAVETQHVSDLSRFGRYRVLARLGAGATGTVYCAGDEVLGRTVAVKVLHAGSDPSTRERFLREARAIGAVLHPSILAIYDAGTEGEAPYLVMELAPGGSLRERIQAGPLPIETVRRLGIQIAHALAAAHAAGILHRDVKPANLLATEEDRWKLADFGIARLPDSTLTVTGQFLGSPSYAAPESLRAGEFSPASDVYGLGATLYEALAGVPPHGDHDTSALVRKLEADPPPLHERRAVPRSISDAITAALARDPAKRPSAEALAGLLAAMEDPPRAAPVPAPVPAPAPAPALRSRKRLAVLGAAAGAIALVAAILASGGEDRPPAEPAAPAEPAEPRPTIVDQDGNPVDEETARKVLEELERRARDDEPPSRRGRDKWKKHKGRPD